MFAACGMQQLAVQLKDACRLRTTALLEYAVLLHFGLLHCRTVAKLTNGFALPLGRHHDAEWRADFVRKNLPLHRALPHLRQKRHAGVHTVGMS